MSLLQIPRQDATTALNGLASRGEASGGASLWGEGKTPQEDRILTPVAEQGFPHQAALQPLRGSHILLISDTVYLGSGSHPTGQGLNTTVPCASDQPAISCRSHDPSLQFSMS